MGESFGVGIVGCGYVGPVTAACLAHLGHRVVCVDKDEGKLAGLRAGTLPIYEPGVQEWFLDGGASPATAALLKRSFGALNGAEALFIAVESARGGEWAGRSMR
jgi:UDPglucose 6-dehydrogenase